MSIQHPTADTLIEFISSRRSIALLDEPAPCDAKLKQAIACALTAPDHRRLTPWRFFSVRGEARLAIGRLMAEAAAQKLLDETGVKLDDDRRDKLSKKALRAPLLIVCTIRVVDAPKVPTFEQLLSGGAAIQNLLLALEALGYGTMWRTGDVVMSEVAHKAFNLKHDDYIAGIIYVGTKATEPKPKPPLDVDDFLTQWTG